MSTLSKAPTYNLKVVLRETGIKADTLRAWERRYGLPKPERTPGGHRLYSQYDIETIRWLHARQEEGMRIHQAVDLWRSMQVKEQDPLLALPLEGIQPLESPRELVSGDALDELKAKWIAACMAFDEPGAENILAQAFARYPMETVCLEILRSGLSQIGGMWYAGESTVQQEHFASSLAIRRLDAMLAATPRPTRKGKVLIGCPPGEEHIFSPLMVTLFLRHRGYDVVYLGSNIPLSQLEKTLTSTHVNLVVMAAQQLSTAAALYEVAQFLLTQQVALGYGGRIFTILPGLRERIPGHFLGEKLEGTVQAIEQLMNHPVTIQEVESSPESYSIALKAFGERQPLVEAFLWEKFKENGMQEQHLRIANEFLGKNILAGLTLGKMEFLNAEMDWIESLLETHGISKDTLPHYLALYQQAIKANMGKTGQPIIEWFSQVLA